MQFVKSLSILLCISTAFSLPLSNSYGSFLKWFVVFSIVQVICYNLYIQYISYKASQVKIAMEAEYSKQGVSAICPCQKANKIFIPIRLDQDNSFKCLDCKEHVSVDVQVTTAIATQALNLDKEEEQLKAALSKIKEIF